MSVGLAGLPDRVLAMARELRASGVGVSTAEVHDALEALALTPLVNREAFRASLATTMAKDSAEQQTFQRIFDLYFPPPRAAAPAGSGQRRQRSDEETTTELTEALREGDSDRLRDLARERIEERGDVQPDANVNEDGYLFRALRGLNLDAILNNLREEEVEGRGLSTLERRVVEEDLSDRMEQFRQMMRDEVVSGMVEELGPDALATRKRRPPPEEVDFMWASQSDLEGLRSAVAPLARKLMSRHSHRRRTARRGRLDVRRTLRRSLSFGGHMVEPKFRKPIAGKPELVVLCDISGSMRAFAKFTLELTYALATQFQRVRTFVFIDALDEVTPILTTSGDFATALARVERDADVVTLDGQSWYGNALEQFWQRAGHELAPRSTVLVLGDARTNFRTTGDEYLQRVHEHVRSVYWLNPEPRAQWDTGDSSMGTYSRACDQVFEVRNLRQLEEAVARIL